MEEKNQKVQRRPIISLDPPSLKYFNARFLIAARQSGFGNAEKVIRSVH